MVTPANDGRTIDLDMPGFAAEDADEDYWRTLQANLRRQYDDQVRGRIERQEIACSRSPLSRC